MAAVTAGAGVDGREGVAEDDATVIERSWADVAEFATVYDRHAATIHRYLSRRAGGQLADDLTGETFLVALRQRQRYDLNQRNALPWLYGIATNLLRRHRRTEVRQYRAFARSGVDPVTESHADAVSARVAAEAVTRELAAALADLPADQRDVLLLVAWGQMTYEEIATALGVPIGTVRSRLSRARGKVRAALPDSTEEDA
jgi:RNA polymerase sigma-70 factor (ECF subfamily)